MGVIGQAQTDTEKLTRHRSRSDVYQNMTVDELKPVAKTVFGVNQAYRVQILPGL